jgi:hypothetical protein
MWPPLQQDPRWAQRSPRTFKVIETEVGQFSSSETTAEQDGNDRTVPLAFERRRVGRLPQRTRFLRRQPISPPDTKFLETFYATGFLQPAPG